MFSRVMRPLPRQWRAFVIVLAAVAGLVIGDLAAVQAAVVRGAPAAQAGAAVPVHVVHGTRARVPAMTPWHRPATSWPAAGTATVALTAPSSRVRSSTVPSSHVPSSRGRASADPSAGSVRAGDLPVWVGPPDSGPAAAAPSASGARGSQESPGVRVSIASQQAARALGIRGVVLSVAQAGPATGADRVHVSVSYAGFAQAYGGDYGSRLRLLELPGCALTDPSAATCRTQIPLGSRNDARRDWVGADATLPAAPAPSQVPDARQRAVLAPSAAALAAPQVVLAVQAGPSGSAGNFAAEPLSEADTGWVSGQSSGAYNYTYPVTVPPVPGGLEPTVALDYDSQATSGLTSSTNNEASWAGDGWTLSPGYIEVDYTTCSADAGEPDTGDLCPNDEQVSLSLNGSTTPLVDGSGTWAAQADGGEKIKQSGTTWEITEPDGDEYFFGENELPGYASGDPTTNSVWDVPVWEGCDQAAFCEVPWRYNLDYEVDPHGNAIAYFYSPQTNYYAESDGTTGTGQYTQGGVLTSIEYGLRSGQVYTSTPAAQITFSSVAGRQDAPTDLTCAQAAACSVTAPSFWNDDALSAITTQVLENGTLSDVDSYALATGYPSTGDPTTSPSLWLESVTQTGEDGGTPITLPPVSYGETMLPNRVETAADSAAGYSDLTEPYLTSVTNDTGGVVSVAYSAPDPAPCAAGSFPAPDANAAACYPDYWTPAGGTSQVQDWFNLYTVASTTQTDTTGAEPPVITSYTYTSPAWHYDTGTISRSATVTWDQYRGYQSVTAETGTPPDPVTQTTTAYLQGMSQDGPPSDTGPVVTLTTSQGQQVTDSDQFAGLQLEQIVYVGAGTGQEVTDTIDLPWTSSAVAVNTSLDQAAYLTGTNSTLTYTTLGTGGTRESITNYTYNSYGLVTATSTIPDTGNSAEDTCSTTSYAVNTGTWLVDLPATQAVYTGACNASGDGTGALVSETEDFYDGQALGVAPTAGNLTKTEQATESGYFDSSTYTYDEYGRVLTAVNPDGDTTTTAYTPATGAEPTAVSVTDPMGLVTTTTYDPARDLPLTVTDPDGGVTATAYDALGRKTAEWTAGNPATGPATSTWSYAVSDTAPPVTTEQVQEPGGNYLTTDTIDDSFGDVIEVQQETASGGTDVTDTSYNSDGWKTLDAGPYYAAEPPPGALVDAAASSIPDETGYAYDGDGRVVRQISYDDGTETYETDTSYGGDYTTVTPPAGGTPETTWTNGVGETSAIWQYHAGAPVSVTDPASDYDATTYTYTPGQKLADITDAAGNVWSYTYNLVGEELTASDPDSGTTTSTYDTAGNLMTVTDADGKTIAYTYDADGRKTAEYDTTGDAPESSSDEVASWTYDTLAKGQITSSTAYQNGSAYTEAVTGYNSQELPSGNETIIPSSQGALAGTYTQTDTYAPDGQETSYTDSAAGGLPAETVNVGYNSAGEEDALTGAGSYVDSLSYTNLDQPLQYTMGTASEPAYITDSYDPQTGSLTQQDTQDGTAQTQVDDLNYTYNDVGDITSEADTPSGDPSATDVQCFGYDYLNRLVQAWAQGGTGCAATASASAEGGAAPYWETYSYNTIGNLTGVTSTTPAGAVTTATNTYPAAGAAQPHAIAGQSVTTSSGTTSTSYAYNADGDLTSVTGTSQGQALTWNDVGQLTQDAVTPSGGAAQDSDYVYDANGALLITADPGTTTLYLPDEELSLNASTDTVTGTRYYSLGDQTVAALTGASSLAYLIGDQQGTDSLAINAATLAMTRRYYDPYGNPVGAPVTGFPAGEKGFVGGADDPATGLTDLGAREYQPQTGSFISTDPLLNPYDPQDLNAYTYAADNPASESDPTGASADSTACASSNGQQPSNCAASGSAGNSQQSEPTCVQISTHVCVSPNNPNYAGLVQGWQWVTAHYGVPKNTEDEFSDWYRLCTISPYARACAGELHSAISAGMVPNNSTEVLWNSDLDIGVMANGKAVPIVEGSVADLLENLVHQAMVKFNNGEIRLTPGQLAKIEEDPNLYNAFKGQRIDTWVKNQLLKSGDDEVYNLYITRPGEFGPDITDLSGLPDWVVWYDITTTGQWAAHTNLYYEVFGPNGYGIFWDQIEEELDAEGGGGE
jgi:RHS repeat-associated protein